MRYAKKIVLHAPPWDSPLLAAFVEDCLRDDVGLVCIVGEDCERVHDVVDELIVGDGSRERPVGPITTWHTDASLSDVLHFAATFRVARDASDFVQEVRLGS